MDQMKRVVVTGIGAITPIGNDINSFTSSLQNGVSGANLISLFDPALFKTRFACEVKDFNPELHIDRKEVRRLDRFAQIAICCMRYGLRGINYATVSACASATHAIINAMDAIRLGRNDIVVTGGSEATVTVAGMGGFSAMKALSTRNDDYLTASRPFDKDRDGFVLGEGGACIILESLEHAQKRGATILAEIAGGGATADAYHLTAPHPEGLGATNVMKIALKDAGLNKSDIDYVNVHGTSTPLGDIAETKAIMNVFGDHAYNMNISSTKSMTGHLLGAAGAVESVASILSIIHKFVPPTINHFTDDPALDAKLNFTFNEAQPREVKAALSNTFGFGGHNACVIFKKFV